MVSRDREGSAESIQCSESRIPFAHPFGSRLTVVMLGIGGLATAVTVEGKLIKVGEPGVLLELPKGRTCVPLASILHVSVLNTK